MISLRHYLGYEGTLLNGVLLLVDIAKQPPKVDLSDPGFANALKVRSVLLLAELDTLSRYSLFFSRHDHSVRRPFLRIALRSRCQLRCFTWCAISPSWPPSTTSGTWDSNPSLTIVGFDLI